MFSYSANVLHLINEAKYHSLLFRFHSPTGCSEGLRVESCTQTTGEGDTDLEKSEEIVWCNPDF